jgi:hypothetical protein
MNAKEDDVNALKSIYDTRIINPIRFDSGFYYYKPNVGKGTINFKNQYSIHKSQQEFRNSIFKTGLMDKKKMDDFWLPPTAIVQFYRSKELIKTHTLTGTKKEFYGFNDWEITIQMLCIKERNRTAQQSLDLLIEWANLLDSINVTSDIFNRKGIFSIVIEGIDIKTVKGKPDAIPVELRCVSNQPIELANSHLKQEFFNKKSLYDLDKAIKSTDINNLPL